MDVLRKGDTQKLRKCIEDPLLRDKLREQIDALPDPILEMVKVCQSCMCLEIVIKKGYNVNKKSASNWNALHQAVYMKKWEIAHLLVNSGANLFGCHAEYYDRWKNKALPRQWEECYVPFASAMLQSPKGYIPCNILLPDDINQPDMEPDPLAEQALGIGLEGFTMLMYSCMAWCLPAVRTLVSKGADVHKPAVCGCIPIQVAMIFERYHKVKYLEPLTDMTFCKWNDTRKVRKALNVMLNTDKSDLQEIILHSGLDLNTLIYYKGHIMSPVMIACIRNEISDNFLQSLIECGADINWVDPKTGRTALWWAVCMNQEDKVKVLLDAGPDMFLTSIAACNVGSICIPEPYDDGIKIGRSTTMQLALRNRRYILIRLLVEHGCDFSSADISYLNCLRTTTRKRTLGTQNYAGITGVDNPCITLLLGEQIVEQIKLCLETPRALAESAGIVIRRSIGYDNIQFKINCLPLPEKLKRFLYTFCKGYSLPNYNSHNR